MKKFFTLIAAAFMAVGANAQTTISLKGLTTGAFTFDANYYETSKKTVDEVECATFTYKGGGKLSDLELTGKNVKFSYKNSSKKSDFFILAADYFTLGGKGTKVTVSNVKKGQKVTFKVAAKADGSTPSFAISNAILESGDATTLTKKNEFLDLTYVVVADGDVALSEDSKGYNIESITIAEGTGEVSIPDGTYFISFDGQEAANVLEYAEGFKLQITGNTGKTIGGGNTITIGGKPYKSMKVSNGAENTLTLPAGKVASGIKFYSYVNGAKNDEKPSYWKEVAGVTFESAEQAGGIFASYSDAANPDVIEYAFDGKANAITFTNTGVQCCYVIEVNIETAEPTSVTTVTVKSTTTGITSVQNNGVSENGAIFNLAGQKVSNSYKGVVIQNGKKMIQK